MHRICELSTERGPARTSRVRATLSSPELGRSLSRTGEGLVVILWTIASLMLLWLAWQGFLGRDQHLIVIVPVLLVMTFWLAWNGRRLWREQESSRTSLDTLTVILDQRRITIFGTDASFTRQRSSDEIHFSARPHRRGKLQEHEEKHVGRASRNSWEVWFEAGVDVDLIVAVAGEEDARAIARHLHEENLHVTGDADRAAYDRRCTAPAQLDAT